MASANALACEKKANYNREMETISALIVAAGRGTRAGGGVPKQYRELNGKAVLAHTVEAMLANAQIDAVRVCYSPR